MATCEASRANVAQTEPVDGTSDGVCARPSSADVLIALISPIILQAGRAASLSSKTNMAERSSVAGERKRFNDVTVDPAGARISS